MNLQHGINTFKDDTGVIAVSNAAVGIPFFIGAWPCHLGCGFTGKPQLATTFAEAQELGGYSDKWRNEDGSPRWNLSQAMYAHFKLNGMSPAIFYNVFNPETHKNAATESTFSVTDHLVEIPEDALINGNLVVKNSGTTLVIGEDFEAFYVSGKLCVELLEKSSSYSATELEIAYDVAAPEKITAKDIEMAIESVELCRSVVGIVPDLLCAPGWTSNPTVAAVLAAKAPSINGLFRAKAIVDIDAKIADSYDKVLDVKNNNGYTSEDMIVCWPMVKNGDYIFDMSAVVCGLIAKVDSGNADCPYESPSNKSLPITGAVDANGNEINLSLPQADIVSVTDGVVTAINNGGWTLWGNYLGCYPKTSDVAKMFICTNRVQDWICNTFVNTFWQYLDRPFTPVLRDAIINAFNSWLNGLTAEGKIYGGQIAFNEELNPVTSIMAGMFRLDCSAASPVPAQRIDMHVRYSVDMLRAALS